MAECPICKSEAEVIEPGQIDGATFSCPMHGEFSVAGTVLSLEKFMNADSTQWERALRIAKTKVAPGKRPKITSYEF